MNSSTDKRKFFPNSKMTTRERREAMIEYLGALIDETTSDKEMRSELEYTRDQLIKSLNKLEEK